MAGGDAGCCCPASLRDKSLQTAERIIDNHKGLSPLSPITACLVALRDLTTKGATWHSLRHSLWHTLHRWHAGHVLHGATGQIIGAVGAEGPAQLQQALALGAGAFELLTTGRADLEISLDAGMTIAARLTLGHLGEQGFFLQLALIGFGKSLTRTENKIDEESTDKEDSN